MFHQPLDRDPAGTSNLRFLQAIRDRTLSAPAMESRGELEVVTCSRETIAVSRSWRKPL